MSRLSSIRSISLALGISILCYTVFTVLERNKLETCQPFDILAMRVKGPEKPSVYQLAVEKLNSIVYSRRQLQGSSEKSGDLYIEEIFIALKTTPKTHSTRVKILMETWIPQANGSVYVMSNGKDDSMSKALGGFYVDTGCGVNHLKKDMLCKMQVIYNKYMDMEGRYKWLCTVDDDNYVNIPRFVEMLRKYNHSQSLLIGKPSFRKKFDKSLLKINGTKTKIRYWFPTGGAGVCFSRGLTNQMLPICGGQKFIERGYEISAPDDATIGYVCDYLLKVPFIMKDELHSEYDSMAILNPADYHKQVTYGYRFLNRDYYIDDNRLLFRGEIPEFNLTVDPTRYLTLHCYLFPTSKQCLEIKENYGPLKSYVGGALSQKRRFPV